ncbi:non-ribosomal peptide synthetase [Beijerinckiaceae bacterium]|nr:non-ribosomal peptide synthetase [Beijerinckiaceae bacterium]
MSEDNLSAIAVIGMAGRFPGAPTLEAFWDNLRRGVESITHFPPEELEDAYGRSIAGQGHYVNARALLEGAELFDAGFFNFLPREAELTDPQQRVFLEIAWEALESAGYDPAAYKGDIAVYAGSSVGTYLLYNVLSDRRRVECFTGNYQVGEYPTLMGNGSDFIATRTAYKLDLRGPALTVQSACSTSLLAIAEACQCILDFRADMALAGGVSITFPQKRGYLYQEGGMVSPDGHCRTFDADAAGTVFGSGAGVVLLKRLEAALADGDPIHAIIRGSAVNNDGARKVGYTAPSSDGQAKAIAVAHAVADVSADSISYVECHGTATPLGDPIEVAGLTKAFRATTDKKGFCAIGTVKTNIGHLDIASGVTGLIKTILSLKHESLPATLHFKTPNPKLELENSPFFVSAELRPWPRGAQPRRAGVSAAGVGGTNVHLVIEEAPQVAAEAVQEDDTTQLIVVSARDETALAEARERLAAHLERIEDQSLGDIAFTLQTGRRAFSHRFSCVADDKRGLIAKLRVADKTQAVVAAAPKVAFQFPGQGAQYPGMGEALYRRYPAFQRALDQCAVILEPLLGLDLRTILFGGAADAGLRLQATSLAQPALFSISYSVAALWRSLKIEPAAMIGHSVGEFVAATLSGVMRLEDALVVVAARGAMMQDLPKGGMLAVMLKEAELLACLPAELSIAAVNAEAACTVAGPLTAIDAFEAQLTGRGVGCRRLRTSHAFHSAMVDPVVEPLAGILRKISLNPPTIPYVSTLTGNWITAEQATDPLYWAGHCRETVRYAAALETLTESLSPVLIEVGPGRTLSSLARQSEPTRRRAPLIANSLPDPSEARAADEVFLETLGRVWATGALPDWHALYEAAPHRRVTLPTYPFQRQRYFVDAVKNLNEVVAPEGDSVIAMAHDTPNLAPEIVPSPAKPDRQAAVRAELATLLESLSGIDVAGAPGSTSFLELGFDSLFLTQASQAIKTRFKVAVSFREMMGDLATIDALTQHLDRIAVDFVVAEAAASPIQTVQAEGLPSAAPRQTTFAPSIQGTAAPTQGIEQVMAAQLASMTDLINRQLDTLRQMGGAAPASAPPAPIAQQAPAPKAPQVPAVPQAKPSVEKKPVEAFGPFKPFAPAMDTGLNAEQQRFVADLIERYTRRTPGSKAMTQASRAVLADPRVAAGFHPEWKEIVYPIVTVRSAGSKLWDVDGNEYIDILNGFGPTAFGHAPDFIRDALIAQINAGFEIGPQTPLAGEVAKLFCDLTGNERMTFCNTGSEAVMAAMRIARTVTGRNRIVYFTGDYHGQFDEVLARGTFKDGVSRVFPIAPGIPSESISNITILDYGTPESLAWLEQHCHELAAVLVEPVQSRRPSFRPRKFLESLRELTAKTGTCLILDEIVTGFRVHPGGVQALFDIRADLVTYGKVVGGGMPIGILAGKAQFMDALDGGYWQYGDESFPAAGVTFFAGTFVRHPLTLAATAAVLKHLKAAGPALQQHLSERAEGLVARLNAIFERHGVPVEIQQFRSVFFFKFGPEQHFGSLFYYLLRERGLHIQEGFPCFLTTAHDDADLAKIVDAFDWASAEMAKVGLFGQPPKQTAARQGQLTQSQMEIWLSAQLGDAASSAFNESVTLHLDGQLDVEALRKAIRDLLHRHDALRLHFEPSGDSFTVSPDPSISFTIHTPEAAQSYESLLQAVLEDEASNPFDLGAGPLIRFTLVADTAQARHALVITAHHIVCDGWSTNIILEELGALYSARLRGTPTDLPAPHSFVDYALHHGAVEKETEAYWLQQFAQLPEPLALPLDRGRPPLKSFRGNTVRATIDRSLTDAVKQAAARKGCTFFSVLLTAYQLLLARLSGQDDIVVGIPTAGQSLHGEGSLVGHCVNFLPLRSQFPAAISFSEAATKTQKLLLDATDHQSYTFGSLVRALEMPRSVNRLPLIDAQFNLERLENNLQFEDLAARTDANPKRFVNFDLFFNVIAGDHGLTIDCDYSTDLFDRSTIERWVDHYRTLLTAIAQDMDRAALRLPMLTKAQEDSLHSALTGPGCPIPEHSIHGLIDLQAAATPDAIAVRFEDRSITYRELVAHADNLAGRLLDAGVARETPVAVYLDRSIELVVALLGILKSGAAYVPLDPIYPPARVEAILSEADVQIVLTSTRLGADIKAPVPVRVHIDDAEAVKIARPRPELPIVQPTDLAYRIFTSGSTGRPKGIDIEHRSVVNLLGAMRQSPGIGADDVFLAVTTPCFDIAALEIFLPLTSGAELTIASRADTLDPFRLVELIRRTSATMMQATPALWRVLLEAGLELKGLKILCGGEALDKQLAQDLAAGGDLWNMYGPTETTIWSVAERQGDGPVDFGRPIANTQLYILDAAGNTAAIGVEGELCIAGAGLARGYYKNQALTAQSFTQHPFSDDRKMQLYRTGDRARYLANHRFELLGRIDQQIKLRGFRIELGDVEDALRRLSGRQEVAAAVHDDNLVGYIVAPEDAIGNLTDLRAKLLKELPDYMVPARILRLDALPRTQNGKINRKALPRPDAAQAAPERVITPPRNPTETQLAEIWSSVLRVGQVGIDENLFALGADSIDLFRIAARMREHNLGLEAAHLMRHPTIAELALAANDQTLAARNAAPSLRSFRRRAAGGGQQ